MNFIYTVLYSNYIFFGLFLFNGIRKAGWDAKTSLGKDKKRESRRKRTNYMNCRTQKLYNLELYMRLASKISILDLLYSFFIAIFHDLKY